MRAVIICGGNIFDYEYIKAQLKKEDFFICADRGYDHALSLGIEPNLIVGDLDSAKNPPPAHKTIRYPCEKDKTDTEIALLCAIERGFTDFLFIGATGTRLDHTIANIMLLIRYKQDNNIVIINEHNKIMLCTSSLYLYEQIGATLSLIPLSKCTNVTTIGMKYPLFHQTLTMGDSLGISNIITETPAKVSLHEGQLLVIAAKD